MWFICKGEKPWSFGLKAKSTSHTPFSETIEGQNLKRNNLYSNEFILPPFELIPYKPMQTSGSVKPDNDNWSASLNKMIDEIKKIEFDVALVAECAYALPLVSYIGSLNRTAILMGSAIQCLRVSDGTKRFWRIVI